MVNDLTASNYSRLFNGLEDKNKLQAQVFELQNKVNSLKLELEISQNQEKGNRDLEDSFHAVCSANNTMKAKIEELTAEIRNRDKVITEWNETLSSVDMKIAALEAEKQSMESKSQYFG